MPTGVQLQVPLAVRLEMRMSVRLDENSHFAPASQSGKVATAGRRAARAPGRRQCHKQGCNAVDGQI